MHIIRRLDMPDQGCINNHNCPAAFSLSSGDVAFIGRKASPELRKTLPPGSGVGEGEELVVVPLEVFVSAGWDPPAL